MAICDDSKMCALLCVFAVALTLLFILLPEARQLRVITEDCPPYNYMGPDGKITGTSTHIVNGIMKRTGDSAKIELLPWSEGYNIVLTTPNTAIYSTSRLPSRESLFKWVGPIATAKDALFVVKFSAWRANSLEEMKSFPSICVLQDDAPQQLLAEAGFTNLVTAPSAVDCVKKLASGEVVGWVGLVGGIEEISARAGVDASLFAQGYIVDSYDMYISFNKKTPDDVVDRWQAALDAM